MNINWDEIKLNFNKAYLLLLDDEELVDNMSTHDLYDPETDTEFYIRKLYDFFDEHEINCFVLPQQDGFGKIALISNFYQGKVCINRQEAEIDLFTNAFRILNNNDEKNPSP